MRLWQVAQAPRDADTGSFVFGLRHPAFIAILLLLAGSVFLITLGIVPLDTAVGGLAVIWVSALPGLLYLNGIDRTPVPFFPAVGVYYLVFFGLPIFASSWTFRVDNKVVLYYRLILNAPGLDVMFAVFGGIASMVVGFYAAKFILLARLGRFRLPDSDPPTHVLNGLYWLLMLGALSYGYVPGIRELPSVGQFLVPASYVAFGGFYFQWRAGRLPATQAWLIVLICAPLEFYARTRILYLTDILFLAMFFAFVLWRVGKIKILCGIMILGTCLALSYGFIQPFRSGTTFLERVNSVKNFWIDGATRGFALEQQSYGGKFMMKMDQRISPFIHRIGQIWVFQSVFERTPESVPYWMGETYRPLLTAYIPRVLYPDKPREIAGYAFGLRYGFTEASAIDQSSYNIPWIVELFGNFGYAGLILGMGAIGLLLAFLDKLFNADGMSDLEFLIGIVLLFRLVYPESNFSVMTGAMPLLFVSLYIYFAAGPRVLGSIAQRFR